MSLALLLLLGMGTAFAVTFAEEASPVYFAPWLRSLLTLGLSIAAVACWTGLSAGHAPACFATAFIASLGKKLIQYVEAAADEKTTAIVARRYARRGPML